MSSPFGRTANNKDYTEGGEFEIPKSGLHMATLVGIVDLGTHDNEFEGKVTSQPKVFLIWELASKNGEGVPFVVGEDYTDSFAKKANYRKVVEGWIGRALANNESFDPVTLLGTACVVNLSQGETKKGKKFVKVASVAPLMGGMPAPQPMRKPFAWHMSQITCKRDKIEIPEWVPRIYGREVIGDIEKSKEWQELPALSTEHLIDNPVGAPAEKMTTASAY